MACDIRAKNIDVLPGRKSPTKENGSMKTNVEVDADGKSNNISVFVRVRPLTREEKARGEKSCVQVLKDTQFIKVVDYGYGYNALTRKFQFDGCIGHEVGQDQVMEKCKVQRLLDSVLEGYSSAVIACGQTGSGKTYTMCGRNEDRTTHGDGLIAQCVTYLFEAMKKDHSGNQRSYSFRASYYEVYNEQVNDLLRLDCAPRDVKWSVKDGYYVDDLLLVDCECVDDVFSVLNEGAKNRKVGSHDLNKDSSRSHCIMTLHVDSCSEIGDGAPIVRYGKMLFVDLAGSERLKKSRSSGDMLKETGNINRSLFTLGKVISALAEGKKGDLVPYRESMLTKLLMETLGGNSLSLMIACISPASSVVEETLGTLYYATCTKTIVNVPSINIDEKDKVIVNLRKEIEQLKKENILLRSKLGLPAEGDIKDNASSQPDIETNQKQISMTVAPFSKSVGHVGDENEPDFSRETLVSNQCGWMLDKERMLTQLRTAERLLCNKMAPSAKENSQDALQNALWQQESKARVIEGIENLPSRTQSFPNVQPLHALSEDSYKNKSYSISRGRSDDVGVGGQDRKLRLGLVGKQGNTSGTYRGLDANQHRLQPFSRRNRISVDHLSSRLRSKSVPRSIASRGGGKDTSFQGSITVNQNAFLRLLDINVSDKHDNI
ncbi:hypothetical protein KP509_28G028000 [Ceratopteris richardii]|nr:hypothetical protein KP509_28G028000 [Ceratopteris richardii]KAH7293490.1 hypothetical protein KP509_28G028000 [Ceratopteris richardii]